MLPKKLAFVDLETTGSSASYSRILELGIILVEEDKIVDTFSTLVNPQSFIPPEIELLTGIRKVDVENAPSFNGLAKDISSMLQGYVFVAHNVRFDYGFLKAEFARNEISFSAKHFCTVRLSRLLYPTHRRHNLDSIIERFGFSCKKRHRALDDAKIIQEFYQVAKKSFSSTTFEKAVNTALKKPSTPLKLQQSVLDTLPEQPGVYIMYGSGGTPLYIGKSVNIKERVLSHFSSDIRSPSEMKITQQIESIEVISTPGELGALVLESSLIKKLLPLYNKKLRIKRELLVLKNKKNKDGYETAYIEPVERIYPEDLEGSTEEKIHGLFSSRRQAKTFLTTVAKEYTLCEKLLQLESTNASCFPYRLGACNGACTGKELALKYNMRFAEAFSGVRIKPWPFQGPVVIEERNDITGEMQYFFIDKWCYLGSITADTKGSLKKTSEEDVIFDTDIYKILRSYLYTPKHLKNVKQLKDIKIDSLLQENAPDMFA